MGHAGTHKAAGVLMKHTRNIALRRPLAAMALAALVVAGCTSNPSSAPTAPPAANPPPVGSSAPPAEPPTTAWAPRPPPAPAGRVTPPPPTLSLSPPLPPLPYSSPSLPPPPHPLPHALPGETTIRTHPAITPAAALLAAEDLFFTPTGARNTQELINVTRNNLQADYHVTRGPTQVRFAAQSFVRFDYVAPVAGLHWQVLATQIRCHLVQLVFTSRDKTVLARLVQDMSQSK